jgi:hypothetical protein
MQPAEQQHGTSRRIVPFGLWIPSLPGPLRRQQRLMQLLPFKYLHPRLASSGQQQQPQLLTADNHTPSTSPLHAKVASAAARVEAQLSKLMAELKSQYWTPQSFSYRVRTAAALVRSLQSLLVEQKQEASEQERLKLQANPPAAEEESSVGGCVSGTSSPAANVDAESRATWQLQHQRLPMVTKYVLNLPPRQKAELQSLLDGFLKRVRWYLDRAMEEGHPRSQKEGLDLVEDLHLISTLDTSSSGCY